MSKPKNKRKNIVVRRVLWAFSIIMFVMFIYQSFIGNPFFDEVSPVLVMALSLLSGIFGLIIYFRQFENKRENG